MMPLDAITWPGAALGEAMTQLARTAGVADGSHTERVPAEVLTDRDALDAWVDAAAACAAIEAMPVRLPLRALGAALVEAAPVLLAVGSPGSPRFAAVLDVRRGRARVLAPSGARHTVRVETLLDAIADAQAGLALDRAAALLDGAKLPAARHDRARRALCDHLLGDRIVDAGWALARPPSARFARQLRDAHVPRMLAMVVGLQIVQQALSLLGWWLVGRGALEGRLEPAWLAAWALVLASTLAPRIVASWVEAKATLAFSILLKRRLLHGALRLAPDDMRQRGSGALLGTVIESDAVEDTITSGGLAGLVSVVELASVLVVLALVPSAGMAAVVFVVWGAVLAVLAVRHARRIATWTRARLDMTQGLVERMVGHRTRLVQEPRERWHDAEDAELAGYGERSRALDRLATWMAAALPRGWLMVGLLAIAPGFLAGTLRGATLAATIGAVLLGQRALSGFAGAIASLVTARLAWRHVRPLFQAGGTEERPGVPARVAARDDGPVPILEARDVRYRYATRHEPALRGASLRIARGDRVLVEGPSGSGKSTLGAILTGLRAADGGLLLFRGIDPQTLGETAWRRRVAAVPQFHENHVLSSTLAFNVLMGRRWPPREGDLRDAEAVCRELGLGELLEKMPSGLMQQVGETGWQLSHGERTRVFLARALLQGAELVVLDESFAALDGETLERAARCVRERAPAVVVIAHP